MQRHMNFFLPFEIPFSLDILFSNIEDKHLWTSSTQQKFAVVHQSESRKPNSDQISLMDTGTDETSKQLWQRLFIFKSNWKHFQWVWWELHAPQTNYNLELRVNLNSEEITTWKSTSEHVHAWKFLVKIRESFNLHVKLYGSGNLAMALTM